MEKQIIYNEDCFSVLDQMPDKTIDLVITDPPYLISDIRGSGSFGETMSKSCKQLEGINESYDISKFAELILQKFKKNTVNAYFFCNKLQIPEYLKIYVEKYKCKFDILTWHKRNVPPLYSGKYLSDTEYILYFRKGAVCNPANFYDAHTYFCTNTNVTDKKQFLHPTIKPLPIIETLIRNSSKEKDVVFDGFAGSGTTGVACMNLNRNFIGCEINKMYYETAEKRIKNNSRQLTINFE